MNPRALPIALALVIASVPGSAQSASQFSNTPSTIPAPGPSGWSTTGSMALPRSGHNATLLSDGRVLVTGGAGATAELYDPASGRWSTTGALAGGRLSHTATLLPDGKVLVAGGTRARAILASAEIYDPVSGTWTASAEMRSPRSQAMAVVLSGPNCGENCGKVLVAGGTGGASTRPHEIGGAMSSAELYDPRTDTWSDTADLDTGRFGAVVFVLVGPKCGPHCGKVLVAGGYNIREHVDVAASTAELYDPATGTWAPTGGLTFPRVYPDGVLLADGRVLLAGGIAGENDPQGPQAQLYDPATGRWSEAAPMQTIRLVGSWLTPLSDGRVLAAGGAPTGVSEIYDPDSGAWTITASMVAPRMLGTMTLLSCGPGAGRVLLAGGTMRSSDPTIGSEGTNAVELFTPDPVPTVPACGTAQRAQAESVADGNTGAGADEPESSRGVGTPGALMVVVLVASAAALVWRRRRVDHRSVDNEPLGSEENRGERPTSMLR